MELNTKRILTIAGAIGTIDMWIGTGALKVSEHMIPAAYIPAVQDWATFLGGVILGGISLATGVSWAMTPAPTAPEAPPAPTPIRPPAAAALLFAIGLTLSMLLGGQAHAQPKLQLPQLKPPSITGNIGKDLSVNLPNLPTPVQVNSDIDQALMAIDQVAQPDLETAIKVFEAAGNQAGKACFSALLDVVKANAAANAAAADLSGPLPVAPPTSITGPGAADKAAQLPIKNAFTRVAQIYNLVVANQPGSPVQVQCAAMKQDFKSTGPMSALLGSSLASKITPILKVVGFGA